ncbi:hypothetical protein D3C79_881620 [compost metagenome]
MLRVRRIVELHHTFHPHRGTFAWNAVDKVSMVASQLGGFLRVGDTARPAQHDADVAIGEIRDELGRIEVGNMGAQLQQQFLSFFVIVRVMAVVWQSKVVQCDRNNLARRVQHGHTALTEFG